MSTLSRWREIKAQYPDVIIFWRMGDFYEAYNNDATICSTYLGTCESYRTRGIDGTYSLTGFPKHKLEEYLSKLTKLGWRVAVCDQLPEKLSDGILDSVDLELSYTPEEI